MSLQLLLGYSATPVIRSSDEFAVGCGPSEVTASSSGLDDQRWG